MSVHRVITDFLFFRGRVALYHILRALGVGRGDEVVTQAFTCVAVPEAIMAAGAVPVYCDVEKDTFTLDPAALDDVISSRTKALIVQHTFGIPADMAKVVRIAREKGIPIVEDCCHALFSTYGGERVGTFGVAAFYSFEWGKPIVAGIGGAAVLNDESLRSRVEEVYSRLDEPPLLRSLKVRLQYIGFKLFYKPSLYWRVKALFHFLGRVGVLEGNYNPMGEEVPKDFGLKMIPSFRRLLSRGVASADRLRVHSMEVVEHYSRGISSARVRHPRVPDNCEVVYSRYPLLVEDKPSVVERARREGVEVAEWYATPVHPLRGADLEKVHYRPGSCPNAEDVCGRVLSLPVHTGVGDGDVCKAISFFNEL